MYDTKKMNRTKLCVDEDKFGNTGSNGLKVYATVWVWKVYPSFTTIIM